MGFRDKMKKSKQDLTQRHKAATKEGQKNYGSIFISEKIPKGVSFWSPGIGEHSLDVIPFFCGTQHPHAPEGTVHFMVRLFVYTNSCSNGVPYVSPFDNWGEPDPIRDYMVASGRLPIEEFKRVASKDRCAFLVWVHDNPEEEKKGLQIWEASYEWSYKKMEEISELPMGGGHIPFADPDQGKRIYFKMTKSGKYTDHRGVEREGREVGNWHLIDRPSPIPDAILDSAFPLDECIKMRVPYAELYKAFWGKEYVEGGSAPVDEKPPSRVTEQKTESGETERVVDTAAPDSARSQSAVTDSEPEQKRSPLRRNRQPEPQATAVQTGDDACPHGHRIGHDIEKFPECNACEKWSKCSEIEDKLLSSQQPAPKEEEKKAEPAPQPDAQTEPKRRPIIRRK